MKIYRILASLYLFIPVIMIFAGYILAPVYRYESSRILFVLSGGFAELFAWPAHYSMNFAAISSAVYFLIISLLTFLHTRRSLIIARNFNWLLIPLVPFVSSIISLNPGERGSEYPGFVPFLIFAYAYAFLLYLLFYLPFMVLTHFVITKELQYFDRKTNLT